MGTGTLATVDDFVAALAGAIGGVARDWWAENAAAMAGDLRQLALASLETQESLASGDITAEEAANALELQRIALSNTVELTRFMTHVLAQNIADAVFRVIGAAIRSRTGVDLFPEL